MRSLTKIILTLLSLAPMLALFGNSSHAQGVKIGFINDDLIKESYPDWIRAQDQMDVEMKAWDDEAVSKQTELQFPLVQNQIYALLFFDAGNSWLHLNDVKPVTGVYKSYGVGFRIAIPGIGTIGFDFAKPLDDPPDGSDRSWKPHFQIGSTIR